jgi:uncharacterized membrane protein
MQILFFLLFFLPEIYSIILLIIVIVRWTKKEKLPGKLLIYNSICIAIILVFKYLFVNEKLALFGEYKDGSKNWQSGLSNVETWFLNQGVVFILFWITQIIFLVHFRKKREKEQNAGSDFLSHLKN